ncbi:AMP-binding enzyme [Amycolatopsis tolypomycina]|uniref:AMP-binding enzyme n=1 Tax=Amycolatopsis tolypomycina TaxID=208445 RepID=A0A1H4VVV2_9PSEU|nr:AMP-binding protein [Amycolatopsis tolypomycina]SEC85123.1 AMP-binding enzyme [Amycolatopsis tolypomycina]
MGQVGTAFAAQVARRPDAVAVVDGARTRTYRELGDDVDRLARWLVARGVGPETSVGVLARRSYPMVAGMLAILRAGGAFVPLNPEIPVARLRSLVADVRPAVVLTETSLAAADLAVPVQQMTADLDGPPADLDARHHPRAVAYVIQTSGSTGEPKSVQVEMHSLMNLLSWYRDVCEIGPGVRVGQIVASNFDASVKNYLTPLVCGGTLALLADGPYDPRAMLGFIERDQVAVLNPGVPSAVYPLVDLAAAAEYRPLSSIRCLALGGEPTDTERLRPWLESPGSRARVLNIFGPTECADIACYAEFDMPASTDRANR